MLKLLLDEHISPAAGEGLRRCHPALVVRAMREWEDGRFLGRSDTLFLREAAAQGFTLVTFDRRTIPPILKIWGEEGRAHGGVVFVDEKTISPAEIGGLILALTVLIAEARDWDWTNRVIFLRR